MLFLFTEKQLKYLSSLKSIALHLDATGNITAQPKYSDGKMTIYYYGIFVAGEKDISPLEVAEALMSSHTETSITFFLKTFCDNLRLITTKKIQKVETDFSLVLLKSSCTAFNQVNFYTYINDIFDEVEEGKDIDKDLTILHVCSSHLIKTVRKQIKSHFPDKKKQKVERYVCSVLISELIHSDCLDTAKVHFENLIRIYGSPYEDVNLHNLIGNTDDEDTQSKIKDHENILDVSEEDDIDPNLAKENIELTKGKMKSSLYYQKFNELKDTTLNNMTVNSVPNKFYSEGLINYIVNYLMVYYSVWSAAGIALRFGLLRDSNATAENSFKILKHQDLRSEEKIMIPRFNQKNEEIIRAKVIERTYPLKTTRQKKNRCKNETESAIDNAKDGQKPEKEIWKRGNKRKRGPNRYFKKTKYVSKINSDDLERSYKNMQETVKKIKLADQELKTKKGKRTQQDISQTKQESEISLDTMRNGSMIEKEPETPIINESQTNTLLNLSDTSILFKSENKYPANFPNLYNNINGYIIDKNSFMTLKTYINIHQYLDDGVINGFFSFLPDIAKNNGLSLVCFDTLFYDKILRNGCISEGFKKWAKKQAVMDKSIWFIPINYIDPKHWTLLVVLHNHKAMIFFDSLHGPPTTQVVDGMCTFIESQLRKPVQWCEWTLFSPRDIPYQRNEQGVISGNCGVHVCSWALTMATCSNIRFTEEDMDAGRRALANILFYGQSNKERTKLTIKSRQPLFLNEGEKEKTIDLSSVTGMIKIVREPPMNFPSTLEFCSVLNLLGPDEYKTSLRPSK